MLFNSLLFLLGYAPTVFVIYFWLGRRENLTPVIWLAFASLVFYAWWSPSQTIILAISIGFNFLCGHLILKLDWSSKIIRKALLALAISVNLLALCYYKYAHFIFNEIAATAGLGWSFPPIILPLGISFFTFTQIAYLVDAYQGKVRKSELFRYILFVTYFPHLIAGPIIHHGAVMPQFATKGAARFNSTNFAVGIALFSIGLFKKVVMADTVAGYADPIFTAAEAGVSLGFVGSWTGALAYSMQLYYDFSGYSDMAIGLSLMLNVRLPFNFNSPYKAVSIIDFWSRWHISLSTFLRDYLYIPLGGNRRGNLRRYINLFLTMVIGGIWHGAGWPFLIWGILHGVYLIINHGWLQLREASKGKIPMLNRTSAKLLTLFAVIVAWVFFRATNISVAMQIITAMACLNGMGAWNIAVEQSTVASAISPAIWISVMMLIALYAPNSQELSTHVLVREDYFKIGNKTNTIGAWRMPHPIYAVMLGLITSTALIHISRPTKFLYFNF